ncbi:hypothetical protein TorRG33x02_176030 [Trema orientale]|uniref:Uncharacterized protein n=1 Tax=Trema orientale TaxID=63057 RepID=A0A2P5EM53_TREOI|nr:hypothetical protein TorRG33x02_176030 [Trema orientale]
MKNYEGNGGQYSLDALASLPIYAQRAQLIFGQRSNFMVKDNGPMGLVTCVTVNAFGPIGWPSCPKSLKSRALSLLRYVVYPIMAYKL